MLDSNLAVRRSSGIRATSVRLCRLRDFQRLTVWPVFRQSLPLTVFIIAACAPLQTLPPEVRTTTVQVQVPVPVPCFTEDQRPVLPTATPIDPETATTEQLAAAELADAIALADYAAQVDRLFIACSSKGTP